MKQASSKLNHLNQISWQTFFVPRLAILFTYSQAFYERPPEGEEIEKLCASEAAGGGSYNLGQNKWKT